MSISYHEEAVRVHMAKAQRIPKNAPEQLAYYLIYALVNAILDVADAIREDPRRA